MNLRYWFLTIELDQMNKFLDFTGEALEQAAQDFEKQVVQMAEGMPENQREDFFEFHADEYTLLKDDFPRIFYSSFLVSWYSFVEEKLKKLCDKLVPLTSLNNEQRNKLGKGIVQSRKILLNTIGYEIQPEYWQELKRINKIRNKIVHVGGRASFPASDLDISKYLKKHSLVVYHGVPVLNPSHDYCKHLVNFGKDLFSTIYDDLKLR